MKDTTSIDLLKSFGNSVDCRKLGGSILSFRNCLIYTGISESVHCPELNACLLKENNKIDVDCKTVHYGYAIPVSIIPIPEKPNFVELVLDVTSDIEPKVASYLLKNHPEFEYIRNNDLEDLSGSEPSSDSDCLDKNIKIEGKSGKDVGKGGKRGLREVDKMATTAKHDHLVSKYTEPEEDIAAIAKQISDHAEAIYQTWKSRGLAPTEILTCHTNATAADQFGTALTPRSKNSGSNTPVVDLLSNNPSLDANNLEKLVNSFVVEDKARIAAKNQSPVQKNLPTSIQYALRKFETSPGEQRATSPSSQNFPTTSYRTTPQPTQITRPVPANQIQLDSLDTIEMILPEEIVQKETPAPPKRGVEFQGQHSNVSSWPLKNKNVEYKKKDSKGTEEYLDEVRREEQRLINALKSGVLIPEEGNTNENNVSITQHHNKLLQNVILDTISGKNEQTSQNLSLVDYAKIRYKNAQENPVTQQRLEQSKEFEKTTQNQVINITRSRFEAGTVKTVTENWKTKEWSQGKVYDELDSSEDKKIKNLRSRHSISETVPHPELTSQQKQHIKQAGTNPVRPFLTRGSVAERVLIFEKCPTELLLDKRRSAPAITTWRSGHEVQSKAQTYTRDKENQRKSQPPHTTLQRNTKANKNVFIPRFYFPQGKPPTQTQTDNILQRLASEFRTFPMGQVTKDKFHNIMKACECPLYWKVPLFSAAGGDKLGYVEAHSFMEYWKQLTSSCHDQAAKFMKILVKNEARNYLSPEDFIPLIQDVVDTHPGLTFLKEATEFHSRYVHTVIARIYYCVNRSWSGQITLPELRRSNLIQIISLLEEEEDINQITQYFSYEHFYVIYCKFWELDRDHDLFIDRQDLTRHNDHSLSSRMIERIFSGAVTRVGCKTQFDKMSYTEFVWFLLSEEDKQHPTAIEYWFRCMDLDGDGYLSMYELEYFYEEQLQRMELLGIETLPFEDCLCQMLDMIHPKTEGKIALSDLKTCKMVSIFFDTFFNLEKYLDHEQRDPFASQRDHDSDEEISDWDRYAAEEYELLVAEESGNEHNDEFSYDTEQSSEDEISPNLDKIMKIAETEANNKQTITINTEKPCSKHVDKLTCVNCNAENTDCAINCSDNPVTVSDNNKSTVSIRVEPVTVLKSCDSEIQTNGSGSIRIKIQSPINGVNLRNGGWKKFPTMPSLQVTTCDNNDNVDDIEKLL